jgi:hypothetical protein
MFERWFAAGRMDELGSRLVPLLRAVCSGIQRYYADTPFALKVIGKYTKENDREVFDGSYEFCKRAGFRRDCSRPSRGYRESWFSRGVHARSNERQTRAAFR